MYYVEKRNEFKRDLLENMEVYKLMLFKLAKNIIFNKDEIKTMKKKIIIIVKQLLLEFKQVPRVKYKVKYTNKLIY